MRTVRELLTAPVLAERLVLVSEPDEDRPVRTVKLVEDVDDLTSVPEESLVVLTRGCSADVEPYRFDMLLRMAGQRGVTGLILSDVDMVELSTTTDAIAKRADISILWAHPDVDLMDLALSIQREIEKDVGAWLDRAVRALSVLEAQGSLTEEDAQELVDEIASQAGLPLQWRTPTDEDLEASVVVHGQSEGYLCVPRNRAGDHRVARLLLQLTAEAVAHRLAAARRAQEVPVRSRAELLTELLLSDPLEVGGLLHRARAFGVPVDGWHVIVRLELDNVAETVGGDDIAVFECTEQVAHIALQTVRATGGPWYRAGAGTTLLLIRMAQTDPGLIATTEAAQAAQRALQRIHQRLPDLVMRCGVSSVHAGPTGLRAAAAEARTAAADARAGDRINVVSQFDAHGVRRMLVEWYASDTAQRSVRTILEPIDALGPEQGQTALETLRVYLDSQCSITSTASELHIHRNTVRYRINRIFELLDVDRNDPDQLLLLQLACRARSPDRAGH